MATQSNAHYHTVIPRWIHNLFFWRQCLFEVLLLPASRKELVPVYESKFLTCQSGPHRRSPLGCQSCVLRGSTRTPCQLNCPMVYLGKKEHFSVGSRILTFKSRPYYSSTGCQAFISRGAPIEITHNKLETKKKKKVTCFRGVNTAYMFHLIHCVEVCCGILLVVVFSINILILIFRISLVPQYHFAVELTMAITVSDTVELIMAITMRETQLSWLWP